MNLPLILTCGGVIFGVVLLAMVPIVRTRRHPSSEIFMVLTVFWALVAAYIASKTVIVQMNWSGERTVRIMSGDFLSQQQVDADAPPWPWTWIAGLAVVYAGLVAFAFTSRLPTAQATIGPSSAVPESASSKDFEPPTDPTLN